MSFSSFSLSTRKRAGTLESASAKRASRKLVSFRTPVSHLTTRSMACFMLLWATGVRYPERSSTPPADRRRTRDSSEAEDTASNAALPLGGPLVPARAIQHYTPRSGALSNKNYPTCTLKV